MLNFEQALGLLTERQETRIELGLERMREHLARLGDPHASLKAIHVAGTNGKGSTCAILDSVLRAQGLRVGLYTSPHLRDVRERIRVGGRMIEAEDFALLFQRTLAADPDRRLTYFELVTSIAFQHFAESKVDVAVLETGLGGRLDATNVIDKPLAAVITSIGLDHTQYLGSTLASIASEKAGIIKKGAPLVCGELPPEALAVITARAAELGLSPRVAGHWPCHRVDWGDGYQVVGSAQYDLRLLGTAQARNCAVAEEALSAASLPVARSAWRSGLWDVRWPGRFQVLKSGSRRIVLDGAHNAEALAAFRSTWLASPFSKKPSRFMVGLMKDKDPEALARELKGLTDDLVAVEPATPRAMDCVSLAKRLGAKPCPQADLALSMWSEDPQAPETLVVLGSFYLVGEILGRLGHGD